MQDVLRLLLVSGGPQCQNYGVSNLQHGLQDGSHHDEEDDAEEESSVNDLQLNEPSLNSQDQQSDTLRHAPENQMRKQLLHTLLSIYKSLQKVVLKWSIVSIFGLDVPHLFMALSFMKAL